MGGLLDQHGRPIVPAKAADISKPAATASANGRGAAYTAADHSRSEIGSWHPGDFAGDTPQLRERQAIARRANDLGRNNGWVSGAIDKEIAAVIGAEFRPSPRPDYKALGISAEAAQDVAIQAETAWRDFADDPRFYADLNRDQTVSGNLRLAYRHYMIDGDALGILHWREDRPWSTCVRICDPSLLSNPNNAADEFDLRGGVELDIDGAATAYHFRRVHERTLWHDPRSYGWDRYDRETSWGRPIVIHYFDKHRDGQTRGVSRFAPIIEKLKMEDQYGRLELQQAVLNAILGLFITTPFENETIVDMFSDASEADAFKNFEAHRRESHDKHRVTLGGVQIPILNIGERIETLAARQLNQFKDFEAAVLRHIASGIGTSYEQLSNDWKGVSYSGARAILNENWRGLILRRRSFAQRFCQPLYMAFFEEAVATGRIVLPAGSPDFYEAVTAWCRAKWIGPGRGFVDPVKEAQAAALRVALGLSTIEDEAAELTGSDYQDNYAQIAREIAEMPEGTLHPMQENFAALIGHSGGPPMDDDTASNSST